MAKNITVGFLATIVIAALVQFSGAQTTHTVGDALGWVIPPGGASVYSIWAANQTFAVGDTLVFNFPANQHDVTKVNKANFDGCSTSNAISRVTTSPARITINETGEHYFICGVPGHCAAGQKLMINVSNAATSAPAPQPSSVPAPQPATPSPVTSPSPAPVSTPPPSPVAAPSPAPTGSAQTYTVGDNQGWSIPDNAAQFYRNWASGKNFMPGDILVFNYNNGAHDVAEVSKANFDSCNTTNPISTNSAPPTRITLTAGEHYYVCAIPGHCSAGQKLAINVGAASGPATPPAASGPATPPTASGSPTSPTNPSSPSPSGSTTPPPADSSARSLGVAGLSATFLSIIVALLF